jgi:hypothetical protein
MDKEQLELLDEAYENYTNYPLATRHDHRTNILYQNVYKGWCMLNGRSMVSPHPTRHLTQEEFINKCKTDNEFSERWGLKIEERELSLEERLRLVNYDKQKFSSIDEWIKWYENEPNKFYYLGINYTKDTALTDLDVPTKLITITYNDKRIESYE